MRKYLKEIVIFVFQFLMFYVFPLFAGPTDAMGMVILILLGTMVLSFVLGLCSNQKIKFLYPAVAVFVFLPSVWIYYNESALVHSLWYLVLSSGGLLIGSGINMIFHKLNRK